MPVKPFTIGKAARAAGIGVETIRFYERAGLIAQPKKPAGGGARDYGGDAVARLQFIAQAKDIGFSLAEIAELLALRTDDAAGCQDVRARAMAKRDEVETRMQRLARMRDALDTLIARCPGKGGVAACSILGAMGGDPG